MAICKKCNKTLSVDDSIEAMKHVHKLGYWMCFDCLDKKWRKEAKDRHRQDKSMMEGNGDE